MDEIAEQTKLIKELEASYPPYGTPDFEIHHIKVRDAYWSRRMMIAKRDGDDLLETAKVY